MGGEVIVFALIVAIIGGLGSITGSVVRALMVGSPTIMWPISSPRRLWGSPCCSGHHPSDPPHGAISRRDLRWKEGIPFEDFAPRRKERASEIPFSFENPSLGLLGDSLSFRSFEIVDVVLKIIIFSTLVASYDIILGYTGIVSLGHVMYFGIGSYLSASSWANWDGPPTGISSFAFFIAVFLSGILSILIGFFSLRIRAIFFAMVTLAFLEFTFILSSQLRSLTGGEDGISFKLPGILAVDFSLGQFLGDRVDRSIKVRFYLHPFGFVHSIPSDAPICQLTPGPGLTIHPGQ